MTAKNTSDGTATWRAEEETPSDDCDLCGGKGWIRQDVPVGDPDFGRAIPCSCQQEVTHAQRLERLQSHSNLGALARLRFDSLDSGGRSANAEAQQRFAQAYQAAIEYADDPQGWLLFTGTGGSGKTHLLAAIVNRGIERETPAFYISVPDLLDHLRSTFAPSSETSYDELFEHVRNIPLLALDDLGAHATTPWAQEKLNQILNHRFNRQMPTIISLSVPLGQLDEQLRARLEDRDLVMQITLGEQAVAAPHWQLDRMKSDLKPRMAFENFNIRGNRADAEDQASLEAALNAARVFAEHPSGWLIFAGGEGCGKTHLAIAVVNEIERNGRYVYFAFVPDLLDHLRFTFSPESPVRYDQLFEEVRTAPYLVLDDLGAHSSTAWAEEKLYQIIVHRQEARLPTVITLRDFMEDRLPPPVRSRLKDASIVTWCPISAPDFRDKGTSRDQSKRASAGYPRSNRRTGR